jgi:hypothetical protein
MAQAGKYGELGIEHIPDDEPVFVIRAQDKLALPTLDRYMDLAEDAGAEDSFLDHLDRVRGDIKIWQRQNETKIPD